MAIQNPKNLYSGNAVLLNSTPYINFAINQLAQKQAKNEALDKYFGEQLAKTTTTGMREQEVSPLTAAKDDFQKYYMQNKDAIHNTSKDGGRAYGEVQHRLNQINDIVNSSKGANEISKLGARITSDPDKRDRITTQSFNDLHQHQQPIYRVDKNGQVIKNDYDPMDNPTGFKAFDPTTLSFNEKPYEAKDMEAINKNVASDIKPNSFKTVNIPLMLPDGTTSKSQLMQQQIANYSDDQAKSIMQRYKDLYNTDKRLSYTVDKSHPFEDVKAEHLDDFNTLNDINKKYFGKDAESPADLYAAKEFLNKNNEVIGQPKTITNQDYKTKQAQAFGMNKMYANDALIKNRMKLSQGLKEATMDYKDAKDSGQQDGVLNKFIHTAHETGTNAINGTKVEALNIGGKQYQGKFIDVPHEVKYDNGVYQGKDKDGKDMWKYPDAYYLTNDEKTFVPVFFDGKTNSGNLYVDPKLSTPKDVQMLKVPLAKALLTKKETGGEVTDNSNDFTSGEIENNVPVPNVKTETKKIKKTAKDYGL